MLSQNYRQFLSLPSDAELQRRGPRQFHRLPESPGELFGEPPRRYRRQSAIEKAARAETAFRLYRKLRDLYRASVKKQRRHDSADLERRSRLALLNLRAMKARLSA
jgi:hypothetical protein